MARNDGFLVLGNQLFPIERLAALPQLAEARVLMVEDEGFCHGVRHHKQRLTMVLAAMRAYRDALRDAGYTVDYVSLTDERPQAWDARSFESLVAIWLERHGVTRLSAFEVPGKALEARLRALAAEREVELTLLPSPMFLCDRDVLKTWFREHAPHQASFYRFQRKRLAVLMEGKEPRGGQWSFDADNRKRLPRSVALPGVPRHARNPHLAEVVSLVHRRFADNPGELELASWWLPTTRAEALEALESFVRERLSQFGPYEDALSQRDPFLFHSVLSAPLNLGLLTPDEVLACVVAVTRRQRNVPLSSIEGFVRQLIGWREFVHGVYRRYSEKQAKSNFFGHTRKLTACWYDGTTGLLPLDHTIAKAQRLGWTHHIERLMVVGNLMTLCEIEPAEAHRWFMEMYVDASAWVMGPNVYGMGTFADGGIFATKPYLCSSNYVLKMSDYKASERGEWCEIMDGLYWRFIAKHRAFFVEQARLGYAVQTLDRMDAVRRERIFAAAEAFIARVTA